MHDAEGNQAVGCRLWAVGWNRAAPYPGGYSLQPTAHSLRACNARASGFTLIEVLAALIIVSLGMLGVIEAVSQTASNGAYLRDKTIAHVWR